MQTLILSIHIILAISLVVLILVQHGKGADAGAAFGSGASSTVFGAQGSATFLTKLTTFIALAFFLTSLALAYYASSIKPMNESLIDKVGSSVEKSIPVENNTSKDLP